MLGWVRSGQVRFLFLPFHFCKKKITEKTKMQNLNRISNCFIAKDEIKLSCIENEGYETPELNEKLFLHFRGFKKIENLDEYNSCKSIWLDSNGFSKIENLDNLLELKCLYLSKNLITTIDNLNSLSQLTILDLSYNRISKIENLSCCVSLQTLNLSHNQLTTYASIEHLQGDEKILEVFTNIPKLKSLSINNNEVTKLSHFRKKLLSTVTQLGYLDRPIDEQEKIFAIAFMAGGSEAEMTARNLWRETQEKKRKYEAEQFKNWQRMNRKLVQNTKLEFTSQQILEKKLEVEKAVQEEKAILDIGIDKLATKFWNLCDSTHDQDKVFDEATKQLINERTINTNFDNITHQDVNDTIQKDKSIEESTEKSLKLDSSILTVDYIQSNISKDKISNSSDDDSKSCININDNNQDVIQESLRLFKQQMQKISVIAHPQNKVSSLLIGSARKIKTWNDLDMEDFQVLNVNETIWTEYMDKLLIENIRAFGCDFDQISEKIKGLVSNDEEFKSSTLTAGACKARWLELDPNKWGNSNLISDEINVFPNFQVFAKPTQTLTTSFDFIPNQSKFTSYLRIPQELPSVEDESDDGEEDENDSI
jgi:hypothetical protein